MDITCNKFLEIAEKENFSCLLREIKGSVPSLVLKVYLLVMAFYHLFHVFTGSSPECQPGRGRGCGYNCTHDNSAMGCSADRVCKRGFKYFQLQIHSGIKETILLFSLC